MTLLSYKNHFVTEFVVLCLLPLTGFSMFYFQVFMEKCIFSVEQMQLNQKHFHVSQNISFSFPILYPALFTSLFYVMANAVWGLCAFLPQELLLQQDSRPAPVSETVKVLQQSLCMQTVFLIPTAVDIYLRHTSF